MGYTRGIPFTNYKILYYFNVLNISMLCHSKNMEGFTFCVKIAHNYLTINIRFFKR